MPTVKILRNLSHLGSTLYRGEEHDLGQEHIDAFGPEYVEVLKVEEKKPKKTKSEAVKVEEKK